jgi:hypothetical protein
VSDFESFDTEIAGKVKQLVLCLPDEYNLDYLVYSASNSLSEEQIIMDIELHKVFKRMMFKRFDSHIEERLSEHRP